MPTAKRIAKKSKTVKLLTTKCFFAIILLRGSQRLYKAFFRDLIAKNGSIRFRISQVRNLQLWNAFVKPQKCGRVATHTPYGD